METDYIIVGAGIAGSTLAYDLNKLGFKSVIYDPEAAVTSSSIAAGLINPIVPKRVIPAWNADIIFPLIAEYYAGISAFTGTEVYKPFPFYQIHSSEQEAKLWRRQLNLPENQAFIRPGQLPCDIPLNRGYANTEVLQCGRVYVKELINGIRSVWEKNNDWRNEYFNYEKLQFSESGVTYGDISARAVIFCEGVSATKNPWLKSIPVIPSPGDIIRLRCSQLPSHLIIKQKHWVIPEGNDEFLAGSTFIFQNSDGKSEYDDMIQKLRSWLPPFEILNHYRAERPTMTDRRPIAGQVEKGLPAYVYNGLGTRGCSLAAWLSPLLAQHITNGGALNNEVRADRFK